MIISSSVYIRIREIQLHQSVGIMYIITDMGCMIQLYLIYTELLMLISVSVGVTVMGMQKLVTRMPSLHIGATATQRATQKDFL